MPREYDERTIARAMIAKQTDGKSIDPVWKQTAQKFVDNGGKPIGVFIDSRNVLMAEPVKEGKEYVWRTK